uniref:Uncharacterized protein n=1 Tax=Romanomermis culicivorax TaxID=13658 RepID=A0A915IZY4_ROMCU
MEMSKRGKTEQTIEKITCLGLELLSSEVKLRIDKTREIVHGSSPDYPVCRLYRYDTLMDSFTRPDTPPKYCCLIM